MTSATSTFNSRSAYGAIRRGGGFSLIELLVVIGIILVLAGILLPLIARSYRTADRARAAADLQSISVGLEAYKADFGDYPRADGSNAGLSASNLRGAYILCRAMLGPDAAAIFPSPPPYGDLADGPGFRVRAQGKVYGPYLDADKFKIIGTAAAGTFHIVDHTGSPILYFPAARIAPNLTATGNYIANSATNTTALYNFFDNSAASDPTTGTPLFPGIGYFETMLGESIYTADGTIQTGEKPVIQPYLLWAAGSDGKFGPAVTLVLPPAVHPPTVPNDDNTDTSAITACDDVTNIRN